MYKSLILTFWPIRNQSKTLITTATTYSPKSNKIRVFPPAPKRNKRKKERKKENKKKTGLKPNIPWGQKILEEKFLPDRFCSWDKKFKKKLSLFEEVRRVILKGLFEGKLGLFYVKVLSRQLDVS